MQIVQSRASDASILTAIAKEAKKYWGYSDKQIKGWAADLTISKEDIQKSFVFHIEIDDKIVGFSVLEEKSNFFEIGHMWVLPQHIGRGYGKMLFEHAKTLALQHRGKKLRVVSDPNATGFYQKMGMKQIGEVESSIPRRRMLPILELSLEKS